MVSKNFYRIINLVFLILILFSKINILYFYWFFFVYFFEFLNFKKLLINTLFNNFAILFFGFILVVRSRILNLNEDFYFVLNIFEHLFFAIFVCLVLEKTIKILKIYFKNKLQLLIAIALLFNLIGFLNELFQNFFNNAPILIFSDDSQKDLMINFIGTIIFLLMVVFINSEDNKSSMNEFF